ncbi:GDP-L-fucose synthase 2 [Pyrus ussuriensis x Pyrus communis]|uniref:GDP-L-fucose synthase 2 n=1 Tax=Pyrus ussuriensis x Pyrus communis TaxID=2448454 RepID=A0A5N5FP95_9ROSA|nr:GDP-L-fucose synthase 2 [Pyrus ussuriensis x Pyrus communis]
MFQRLPALCISDTLSPVYKGFSVAKKESMSAWRVRSSSVWVQRTRFVKPIAWSLRTMTKPTRPLLQHERERENTGRKGREGCDGGSGFRHGKRERSGMVALDKTINKKRGHTNDHGHEHSQNTTKPKKKQLLTQLHSKNRAHSSSPRFNNCSSHALSR